MAIKFDPILGELREKDVSAGGSATWGNIIGTLSDQTDLNNALASKVASNAAITGSTKTRVTYDSKGLITGGDNATTADIADSLDKRYVTDAHLTVLGNTSGTNTGDQDLSSYFNKSSDDMDDISDGTTYKKFSATEQSKLSGIATGAEVNVNADWNSATGDSQILNKPTLGTAAAKNIPATGDASATEVVYGTDTRLTNSRTPTSHNNSAHSETYITASSAVAPNAPITGATKTKITYDSKGLVTGGADATAADVGAEPSGAVSTHAALTTGVHGAGANTFVYSNDSRLTDARTPTAHNQAESTITFTDITTGNVSTSAHGYVPKAPNSTSQYLRGDGTWATVAASGDGLGTDGDKGDITVGGTGTTLTIDNNVVTEAKLSISDNTTGNFSTTAHGFVPKGTNVGNYLKDDGTWAAVTASGGATTVKLTGDLASTTSTTVGNTTGLSFSVTAGTYYRFTFHVLYRSAATTTGIKVTVTTPSVTTLSAVVKAPVSTAAGGTASEFGDWITSSGDTVTGTGTPVINSTHIATIEGTILPSANGTLQVQHASEVAASGVTVMRGSNGLLWAL